MWHVHVYCEFHPHIYCLIHIFADFDFGQKRFRCKETRNQAMNRSSRSESLLSLKVNRSTWLASSHSVLLTQYLRLQCCDVCAALLTVLQGRVEFGLQHCGLLLLRAQLQLQLRHARRGRRQLLRQACLPEIQRDDIKPAYPPLMLQHNYSDEMMMGLWWKEKRYKETKPVTRWYVKYGGRTIYLCWELIG